jgi:hypothetical protein
MQDKNLLYPHYEPNKPTKEGPLSYVCTQESPFASVSTVSRGHSSLVSLGGKFTDILTANDTILCIVAVTTSHLNIFYGFVPCELFVCKDLLVKVVFLYNLSLQSQVATISCIFRCSFVHLPLLFRASFAAVVQ